jgi:WD40 repeat protein
VATQDLKIVILETKGLGVVASYKGTHDFPITSLVFLNDSGGLVSGSADGSVLLHDVPGIRRSGYWIWALVFALIILLGFVFTEGGESGDR